MKSVSANAMPSRSKTVCGATWYLSVSSPSRKGWTEFRWQGDCAYQKHHPAMISVLTTPTHDLTTLGAKIRQIRRMVLDGHDEHSAAQIP
jgi:hypothetical protein